MNEQPLTDEEVFALVAEHAAKQDDPQAYLAQFRQRMSAKAGDPVSPEIFLEDPEFLKAKDALFPVVKQAYLDICGAPTPFVECVLTGGIGAGKTSLAIYVMAYELYRLAHYKNPHEAFGLDPASEIEIVFQSASLTLAREVGYDRFRALIERAPFFQKHFRFDDQIKSKLVFPNRIEVKPIAGSSTSALGQNVIGGVIDELGFMETVAKSTRSGSEDGTYDQARVLYAAMSRRRLTRFLRKEVVPGQLLLVSSASYRGNFLESKVNEARENPEKIYLFSKRVWDIRPQDYGKERFRVFTGDLTRKPRILEDGEKINDLDAALTDEVPAELKTSYEHDLYGSLRDFSGVSTMAICPFMGDVTRIAAAFGHHESIFSRDSADLEDERVAIDCTDYPWKSEPHALHIDVALVRDSLGLSLSCVPGFVDIQRDDGEFETLPVLGVAGILEVRPPRGGEISFDRIRKLIYAISDAGIDVKWVSTDQFQSRDLRQQLVARGYMTQEVSVDRKIDPYQSLRDMIYDGRLVCPAHELTQKELASLEFDAQKQKVDHPPSGSKDCADALCGSAWSASRKREVWWRHQISGASPRLRVVRGGAVA